MIVSLGAGFARLISGRQRVFDSFHYSGRLSMIGNSTWNQSVKMFGWAGSTFFTSNTKTIRALPHSEGVAGQLELTFASIPQLVGGLPQRPSEYSNEHGAESSEAIVIGATPKKLEKPHDPFGEGRAGLSIGLIFGISFIAYQYTRGNFDVPQLNASSMPK